MELSSRSMEQGAASPERSEGTALGSRNTILAERALALLTGGPADSASVVRECCQIPAVQPALASHLAVALLGGDSRFFRRLDGFWELAKPRIVLAGQALAELSYVVVDVESTGVRAIDGDRITEVAVVLVKNGEARVVFDSLVNPERPIPREISTLTGISWEMVRNAPRFGDIAHQLAGVLEGHVFVAHNATFDWRFISQEMQRATGRPLDGTRLCTVKLARRLVPTLYRRSLDSLTEYFGIRIKARHRAGGDAVATAEAFMRLLSAAQDFGLETLDDLQRHLRQPRKRLRRSPAMPTSFIDENIA
jgi:DNA polymerase-3 subunit epsilon